MRVLAPVLAQLPPQVSVRPRGQQGRVHSVPLAVEMVTVLTEWDSDSDLAKATRGPWQGSNAALAQVLAVLSELGPQQERAWASGRE